MNWYKYLVYRLYSWRTKMGDQVAAFRVALMMAILHFAHLLIVYEILYACSIVSVDIDINRIILFVGFAIFSILFSIIFNRRRMEGYQQKYAGESTQERKRGTFWVRFFIVSTILTSISLPIILYIIKRKN
ncbi:MAG: hypothetical protein U0U70_17540 [Chitinophagaceae bacterium]